MLIDVAGIHQNILSWDVPSIMSLYTAVPKDPWPPRPASSRARKGHDGIPEAGHRLQIGRVPVQGNIGVQVVHYEQRSDGFCWNDGTGTPTGGV